MRTRSGLAPALAAFLLALSASALSGAASCGGDGTEVPVEARIRADLSPVLLSAYVGTQQNVTTQLINEGQSSLAITRLRLAAPDGGPLPSGTPFTQPALSADAPPDGGLPATVNGRSRAFAQFTFSPKQAGRTQAGLVVDSSAPATPTLTVPIYACGVYLDGGGCTCPDGGAFLADGGC
jgi:hypothetical protein